MNRTQALLPNDYVKGVRVVETTLRPVRPACLIPDDDPESAARFAESRSLAWGGCASYIIPYSRSEGLSEGWRKLLGALDPDRVFSVGKLPDSEKERLREAGWFVYPRDEPEALSRESSTLLYSVLEAVAKELTPPDSPNFVLVPENPRGIVASLPMLARFGGLQEEEMKRALDSRAPSYEYHLDLSELVRIEKVHPQQGSLDILAGDLRGWNVEGVENALTLPELTLRGLRISGRTRSPQDRGAREVEDEYHAPVIVTGNAYNNVEDFALYWNLRAEHCFARPFPLWLTLDTLEEEEGRTLVEKTLKRVGEGSVSTRASLRGLRIVSASTDTREVEERLREFYPDTQIGFTNLTELFRTTCDYYHAIERSTAHFERGRSSIRPPRPETFNDFIPYIDTVTYEVRVDEAWLPQGKAIARSLNRMPDQSRTLVAANGALRFVEPFTRESRAAGLLDVRTPDGWSILSSIFEERGYDIEPTAKSGASLGQLELLGGIDNLKVLAISGIRRLLRQMSSRRGEKQKKEYLDERKTLTFGEFADELGKGAAHDILRWLVEQRVVFRGAKFPCPRCRIKAWYPIDRLQEVWRCDGCQENSPVPLEMGQTNWCYRINELYARGHDQGTLVPLLTLYAMHIAWGTFTSQGSLSFYPGIQLRAKEGAQVPFPDPEIDLVAMRGENLIILTECKESTEYQADEEKAAKDAEQLGKLVTLADHLGSPTVVYASGTTFPVEKSVLLAEVPSDASAEVRWLDGYDLLDPLDYFAHPLTHPAVPGQRIEKPDDWGSAYLDWVRRSINSPTS